MAVWRQYIDKLLFIYFFNIILHFVNTSTYLVLIILVICIIIINHNIMYPNCYSYTLLLLNIGIEFLNNYIFDHWCYMNYL